VGLDSTAYSLVDGSGLATGNLVTPRALVRLLDYLYRHPRRDLLLRGLPRPGRPGSLLRRFVGTPLEARVTAKTGSITHVNSLSGYVESAGGRRLTFSIQANNHAAPSEQILAQIDSVVVEMAR